jgi:Skp family chaperone for outer membrane proteins
MNILLKSLAVAGLSASALTVAATPVAAQVQGKIGTVDVSRVILGSAALENAYKQVEGTYSAQLTQLKTLSDQRQTALKAIDTNGDNEVNDAELKAAEGTQNLANLEALENQITQITNQIDAGRIFAIEQIYAQYPAALEEVITANQVQMVVAPDSIVYAPPEADLSAKVITALNAKVPQAGIVPPAGWQPTRRGVALFQEIQQTLVTASILRQRQQAAEAQAGQPAPSGSPAPVGR